MTIMRNIYIEKSAIHGRGLFTTVNLERGNIIGASHAYYNGFWYMTTHGYYNHSESPNCVIETKDNINLIIAKVDITRGEELTVDYTKQPYLEQPKKDWVK